MNFSLNKHTLLFLIALAAFALTGCAASALQKADEFAEAGKWDEAVLKYAEVYQNKSPDIELKSKYRRARFEAAQIHTRRGEEYLDKGNYDAALLEFQAAGLLDPSLDKARTLLNKTRKLMDSVYYYGKALEAAKDGKEKEAKTALKKSISLNPANKAAVEELDRFKKTERPVMDGYELDIKSNEPITIEFKDAGVKKVFEVLSRLSGINFVFDEELKDNKTTLSLKHATFQQALALILMTNKIGRKVVSENTIVVYPLTPQKTQQYEELMIKVFYLSNTDAKKMVNLLRTMIKAKDMHVHEDLNAIVVRGRPEALELAKRILDASDIADSELMLVVEIFEINRSKAMNLGIDLTPDTITAAVPLTSGTIALGTLKQLSAGQLLIGLPSAILNFKKEDLDANILANPRIRVKNNSKAKIHIGDRVPIITTTVNQGVTTENVQYQDVGLKLNVEPTIRPDDEVDLKLGLEVSSLGTKTITNNGSVAYQIGTRNTETVLRLHDGETQIIGGLISEAERTTIAKFPLLGDIPVIGRLFSSTDSSKVKTDILMSITPHIVRKVDVPDDAAQGFLSGRDEYPSDRPLLEGFGVDTVKTGTAMEGDTKPQVLQPLTTPPATVPDVQTP